MFDITHIPAFVKATKRNFKRFVDTVEPAYKDPAYKELPVIRN